MPQGKGGGRKREGEVPQNKRMGQNQKISGGTGGGSLRASKAKGKDRTILSRGASLGSDEEPEG